MSLELECKREPQALAGRLAGLYGRWWFRYLVLMIVLSWLGFEASYGNPTPFYAVFKPAFVTLLTPFTMLGVFSLVALLAVFWSYGRGPRWRAIGLPALWVAYMLLVV
ncbi:MAG: hypothetical protein RBU21_22100, partial [FCB group bacterium]|nr:hypothetical protein [FCB group bacterium]